MAKERLVVILTETGALESCVFPVNTSAEEIEDTLSESYTLGSIYWMEINQISMKTLELLNKTLGKK